MRAVVQRVRDCFVRVGEENVGNIKTGLLVYLGIERDDTEKDLKYISEKVINLRIFADKDGKMNLSVKDVSGSIMVISQFTLLGDARKGRRPSYSKAARPEIARNLYEQFVNRLKLLGIKTETGSFRATMEVTYTNIGPITILLDSRKTF